jgi:Uma2 family endonuclease
MHPLPGMATEEDLLAAGAICELVDGVLVERAMAYYESRLAAVLIHFLESFLDTHDVGIVLGADGMMRIDVGKIRIPDVAFYSWAHFPNRILPREAILSVVPDLAVEVYSEGNTAQEMERKRGEYFDGGATLVWIAYPETRTVEVYTGITQLTTLSETDTLDGGTVLPGFTLSIRSWFERAGKRA